MLLSLRANDRIFFQLITQLIQQTKMTGIAVFAHQRLIPSQATHPDGVFPCYAARPLGL